MKTGLKTSLSILLLLILYSCFSEGDDYQIQKTEALKEFNQNISEKQQLFLKKYFDNKLEIDSYSNIYNINDGFYCLWKSSKNIEPHISLNTLFAKKGFNITLKKNKLKYFIVSERKSHRVGSYSNGGKASRLETIIIAIDVKTGEAFEIIRNMGSEPPETTKYKWGRSGNCWSDEDIFNNLKNIIH